MTDDQFRARFDAYVDFSNGGHLDAAAFCVDVPHASVTEEEVGALFIASLGLLMGDRVTITGLIVFPEAHRGTRGGPSAGSVPPPSGRLVELNHVITPGMVTYPGLPGPELAPHLTRAASRDVYAPGTEFAIDRITLVGNTGTYLDTPFHRYPDGHDLSGLPLERVAGVPAVVVRTVGSAVRGVDVGSLAAHDVRGRAVLLHTGGDRHFGTPAYAEAGPFLTEAGARWLVEQGAALVGIDSVNIDDTADPTRPAHSVLLAGGVPIVEHLTGLGQLPPLGARFTAVPPRFTEFGTFPVRAFAEL